MVRIISQLILTALLCATTTVVQAHIFMIEKWCNGSQDIYCLSDYHRSLEPQNKICNQQRIDIVDAAKKHNAFVITEDNICHPTCTISENPLEYDQNRNFTQELPESFFSLHGLPHDVPPIIGLTAHCHYANVPVDNREFRLAKAASMHNNSIDAATALSKSGLIRKEILQHNDSPALNKYYQEKIDDYLSTVIDPCTNFFNQLCTQNSGLKHAVSLVPYDSQLDKIQLDVDLIFMSQEEKKKAIINFYDSKLLDLRIIHSIYLHKQPTALFVCAGYDHITRIQPALKLMGFTPVEYYCADDNTYEPTAIDIADYFKSEEPKKWRSSWLESFFSLF